MPPTSHNGWKRNWYVSRFEDTCLLGPPRISLSLWFRPYLCCQHVSITAQKLRSLCDEILILSLYWRYNIYLFINLNSFFVFIFSISVTARHADCSTCRWISLYRALLDVPPHQHSVRLRHYQGKVKKYWPLKHNLRTFVMQSDSEDNNIVSQENLRCSNVYYGRVPMPHVNLGIVWWTRKQYLLIRH